MALVCNYATSQKIKFKSSVKIIWTVYCVVCINAIIILFPISIIKVFVLKVYWWNKLLTYLLTQNVQLFGLSQVE